MDKPEGIWSKTKGEKKSIKHVWWGITPLDHIFIRILHTVKQSLAVLVRSKGCCCMLGCL